MIFMTAFMISTPHDIFFVVRKHKIWIKTKRKKRKSIKNERPCRQNRVRRVRISCHEIVYFINALYINTKSEMKVHDPELYLYVSDSLKSKYKANGKQHEVEKQLYTVQ